MEKICEALSIQFDAVEPAAGGYRVSNSSKPDEKSVWLSEEEWLQLCRLTGWVSDGTDHTAALR
jgi:hypothetical protein